MKEQLITFDTAKLAKERGFNISNSGYFYDKEGYKVLDTPFDKLIWGGKFPAPTQSLLQKWIREEHNIHTWAYPHINDDMYYGVRFYKDYSNNGSIDAFKTYEEAIEKGLYEALKLIKDE